MKSIKISHNRVRRRLRKMYGNYVCARQPNPLVNQTNTIVTTYYDFEGSYAMPGKTEQSLKAMEKIFVVEKRYNIKSTYNTVALYAQEIPDLINELARHGHEIASHSYDHTVLSGLPSREKINNIRAARSVFHELGVQITGHRSPQSSWDYGLMQCLCKEGYSWAAEDGQEPYPYVFCKNKGLELWRFPVRVDDWAYQSENLTPDEMLSRWKAIINEARKTRKYTAIGFHPWLEYPDNRLDAFEEFMAWLNSLNDVSVMPFGDVLGKIINT